MSAVIVACLSCWRHLQRDWTSSGTAAATQLCTTACKSCRPSHLSPCACADGCQVRVLLMTALTQVCCRLRSTLHKYARFTGGRSYQLHHDNDFRVGPALQILVDPLQWLSRSRAT